MHRVVWDCRWTNATISIQPHIKGKMTPEKLLPFPWEKCKKKAEAPKVSAEEARKRFERPPPSVRTWWFGGQVSGSSTNL